MSGSRWVICWMAIFVGLLAGPIRGAEDDLERALTAEKAELDSLKARLEADRRRLRQTHTEEQTVSETLDRLDRDIVQIRGELRNLQRREQEMAGSLRTTQRDLGRVEDRLRVREEGMAQRLREMYKLGRWGTLRMLFSSVSFTDALRRLRYLSRVAWQDRRDYEAIRANRKRVGNVLSLQRVQYAHQRALLQAKMEAGRALEETKDDRERRLQRLRSDASAMARAIREHREAIAQADTKIQELIQKIQDQQHRGRRLAELPPFDFEAHRGRLRRPVAGEVVSRFGRHQDPDLKTWTFNRGINLAATAGTQVRAVAPGEAVLVDWFRGYGQFVLLRHPGGFYSLYGHLEAVLVNRGEILAEGAAIGTVGSTGRLDGRSQLHFEIMQGEQALDPIVWLSP